MMKNLITKIRCKLLLLRLHPISVFLFHQVSDVFEEDTMKPGDWTETEQFKHNVEALRKAFVFVSLDQACLKMKKDRLRFGNFAVMTADDGWVSLKNILPWLKEKNIPVTLFLNPAYFDGKHFREKDTERYLLKADIDLISKNYPNVTFGLHGWEHIRATKQTETDFRESVMKSLQVLQAYPNYVPYYAYTYGNYNQMNCRVLKEFGLIPVLIDGAKNVNDFSCVHRELLDGLKL